MNCGFVVLWFCGFVDCLCKGEKLSTKQLNNKTTKPPDNKTTRQQNHQTTKPPDNKTTRQQNHQTTKPHHFLSNSKEDGSFCHLPFFANFMVEPDFCLRE